ncbi:hypothetical protein [Frankia sp. Cj3]|uniref:hypothetical protein n=1 Tax=Frankia sp. Cj3 TaxID=2880976 RepID=UPI001EF479B0|nr:hypothetical protein [Frankia sp. Cj3]
MGLPAGWVTATPGLTRNAQLTALGNGVIPQQATAALHALLTEPPPALSTALDPAPATTIPCAESSS